MVKKTPLALKFDTDLLHQLDSHRDKLPMPITRTAFIEIAVKRLLASEQKAHRK